MPPGTPQFVCVPDEQRLEDRLLPVLALLGHTETGYLRTILPVGHPLLRLAQRTSPCGGAIGSSSADVYIGRVVVSLWPTEESVSFDTPSDAAR